MVDLPAGAISCGSEPGGFLVGICRLINFFF